MNGVCSSSSRRTVGSAMVSMTSSTNACSLPNRSSSHGSGEYAPMPPGVRARVAVAQALVVLRRRERQHVRAVGEQEQRDLLAVEELLDEHRALLQVVRGVGERGLAVVGDEHALARGEAVGLHDVRGAELVERRDRPRQRVGEARAAGGHARRLHDALRERLRALELRGGLAGAERRRCRACAARRPRPRRAAPRGRSRRARCRCRSRSRRR